MHRSVLNFRDLGGLKVENGTVKPHRLLRGGPLKNLTQDIEEKLLNEYELKNVVDLRTLDEQDREPNVILDGVQYTHLDIIGKGVRQSADPEAMLKAAENKSSQTSLDYMKSLNDIFVRDEHAQKEYREFIQILLKNEEGSTYFHCSAGKDRTGFAAALILKLLGASDEVVMKDYLRTNELNHDNRIMMRQKMLNDNPNATKEEMENFEGYIIVKEEYISEAFKAIQEDYGTFENYVDKVLQINAEDIAKLRKEYVDEA